MVLNLDRWSTLAALYGLGAALLALIAFLPAWPGVDGAATAALATVAAGVALTLVLRRRAGAVTVHLLLLAGTGVITAAVLAAGGGAGSVAVAAFSGWVVVYAALFLPRRQAVLHAAAVLGATSAAVAHGRSPGSALLHAALLIVITASTGLIVGVLTSRTRFLATHDPLTGILNEVGLAAVVEHDLAHPGAPGPGVLLLLDVDRFGELNQALGRAGGDELLRQVAAAAHEAVQQYGRVARLGGDDFAVWLPSVPEARGGRDAQEGALAMLVAAVLEDACGPFEVAGVPVRVDVTIGAALAPEHGRDLTGLLHRADGALHAARRDDRVAALWSEELDEVSADGLQLQGQLREGITAGQLRLHYQPLVDARTQRVHGVEALVRWQHPTRGLLPPGVFLPAAERTSAVVALTEWVLTEALEQAARWWRGGHPLAVSVNLSARLLAHDGLPGMVRSRLEASGLPAGLLTLEVTESAVTAQPRRAAAVLAELRALGVRTALDDFGTGYTSLSMLQDLPFDELKLDQCFVRPLAAAGADDAIARTVVELGHRLGLQVVAEGVEDDATRRRLRALGYDVLQGYHYSRPVPADDVHGLDFTGSAPTPAPLG